MNQPHRRLALYRWIRQIRPAPIAPLVAQLLGVHRVEYQTARGKFYVLPYSDLGIRLISDGSYEAHLENTLDQFLQPGDTFLDIGANEGYFSVLAAMRVGSSGRVIAVEPQKRLLPIIERNCELNGLTNVEIFSGAIGDVAGPGALYLSSSVNSGASSFHRTTRYRLAQQQTVVITLDELLQRYEVGSCKLLKVDVEGFEGQVLRGGQESLRSGQVANMSIEFHEDILQAQKESTTDLIQFVEGCGYRLTHPYRYPVFQREKVVER